MIPISRYQRRRVHLSKSMGQGIAIIPTAPERARNRDAHYLYRFDSYFYYLTGFMEPEAVVVVIAGNSPRSILFCREKNITREIWDGYRHGPKAAQKTFAFDEAYPIAKLDEMMPKLIADQPALHYPIGAYAEWDSRVVGWLNRVKAQVRSGITAPSEIQDVCSVLDHMRLIKDADEIKVMRSAAQIATDAHRRAMQTTRPGMMEYEVEAELVHEFRRRGAQAPAYTSIVAGGSNACVLHYVENNAELHDGDLLLIDAGCELDGYASDITRTFPVNGAFSPAQRDVYELVLAAQAKGIDAVKPNAPFEAYHQAALRVLVRGMIDLKLCEGSVDKVIESGDYRQFFMHRTGHWLGLDVHDAGDYKKDGKSVKLEPGMVVTVEPGCYIRPAKNVPKAFWNIGIRIEDDVLVTKSGREVLTSPPKTVREIEQVMQRP
ncbi:MAG: aminopeptidase P N-terminal domain-containing protein [Burkholderiales bacterium]